MNRSRQLSLGPWNCLQRCRRRRQRGQRTPPNGLLRFKFKDMTTTSSPSMPTNRTRMSPDGRATATSLRDEATKTAKPLISVTPPPRTSVAQPPDNPAGLQPPSSEPPPIPPKTPLTTNAELAHGTHPRPPVPSSHQPALPGDSRPPPPGVSATLTRPPVSVVLPYPDTDGPPPAINMAKKPVRPDRS